MGEKYDHHKNDTYFPGVKHLSKTTYRSNTKIFLNFPRQC